MPNGDLTESAHIDIAIERARRARHENPETASRAYDRARQHRRSTHLMSFELGWDAATAELGQQVRELEALLSMIAAWVPAADGPTLRELTGSIPAHRIEEERADAIRVAAQRLLEDAPENRAAAAALTSFARRVEIDGIREAARWGADDDYNARHGWGDECAAPGAA